MIIHRYLYRELGTTFAGVSLMLLLMFLSGTLVRILTEAAEGEFPASVMFSVFGLKSVGSLMFVLPLSLFLAVLLALGRLYQESEMYALFACGVSPLRIRRVVLRFGLLVAAAVGALSLYMGPLAEEYSQRIMDRAAATARIEGITPGRFNQAGDGNQLIYVERMSEDQRKLENIFAYDRTPGQLDLVTAKRAHQTTNPDTGKRFLVLEDGYRYEYRFTGRKEDRGMRIIRFEEHGILFGEPEITPSKRRRNALSTLELARSDQAADAAEFHWRLAMPISTVLLALLAVPLAKSTPRQGRYAKLFVGILVYILYNNLLTVGRSWVGTGAVPDWLGMWWVHTLTLAAAWALFTWRHGRRRRHEEARA